MKIINPSVELLTPIDGDWVIKHIEEAYRKCYKSEDKICEGSARKLITNMGLKHGHTSPMEHFSFSMNFIVDRGISHEIVRHRLASYSQESTRYCNYSGDKFGNEITVILPSQFMPPVISDVRMAQYEKWNESCWRAENDYFALLSLGATPQEARAVLPHSLKTELEMTADLTEWRHFFKLRCDPAAHPDMRYVAKKALKLAHEAIPVIFDDLWELYGEAKID